MRRNTVMVVDDDQGLREALCGSLETAGYLAVAASDGSVALELMERTPVGMVVTDVQTHPMDGETLLRWIRERYPGVPVVVMSAYGSVDKAVGAMRSGAVDYLTKPFQAQTLTDVVGRFLPAEEDDDEGFVHADPRSRQLAELARRVAVTSATVLITGESGTGKEMYARYIHRHSARAAGPFVAINCAAIPHNMLEAVLFGYEKGAFTGAYQTHPGKFEQAQQGTLLLDEISEIDLSLQAKLLRVLQEREVERLGGRRPVRLDVRVLATSNRNLAAEVAAGNFREDLYYRLNVFPITIPPLARRPGDILPLATRLLRKHAESGEAVRTLSEAARRKLQDHCWLGNVRELENVMQRARILAVGPVIEASELCLDAQDEVALSLVNHSSVAAENGRLDEDLKLRERELIAAALREERGSRKDAARRLGISPRTLRYKMARLREMGFELPGRVGLENA